MLFVAFFLVYFITDKSLTKQDRCIFKGDNSLTKQNRFFFSFLRKLMGLPENFASVFSLFLFSIYYFFYSIVCEFW